MKFLIIFLAALLPFNLQAQGITGTQIEVTVTNVPDNEGNVIISLFTEDTFMKSAPVKSETASITNGRATVTFSEIPAGDYAVISFHDRNKNGRIDMGPTGIPEEAYGVSNNPVSYAPPNWEEARFPVAAEPVVLEIRY